MTRRWSPADAEERIEAWLVNRRVAGREEIRKIRQEASRAGRSLLDMLVAQACLTLSQKADCLREALGIPSLQDHPPQPGLAALCGFPVTLIMERLVFPLETQENTLFLAMADPLDVSTIDDIAQRVCMDLQPVAATAQEILAMARSTPPPACQDLDEAVFAAVVRPGELQTGMAQMVFDLDETSGPGFPIIDLVNLMLRSSDLTNPFAMRLTPGQTVFEVTLWTRQGAKVLMSPPMASFIPVVARLRFMSDSPCPKLAPVAGRPFRVRTGGREITLAFHGDMRQGQLLAAVTHGSEIPAFPET